MKFLELRLFIKQVMFSRTHGKILSLDVGTKHVGVALSDESKQFVSPSVTFGRFALTSSLQEIVNKENVCGLVVGIPLRDGKPTRFCTEIVNLMLSMPIIKPNTALNLEERDKDNDKEQQPHHMPFTLWDEQYSTMEARRLVGQSTNKRSLYLKHKDSVAAAVIMQKFLVHAEVSNNKNM